MLDWCYWPIERTPYTVLVILWVLLTTVVPTAWRWLPCALLTGQASSTFVDAQVDTQTDDTGEADESEGGTN